MEPEIRIRPNNCFCNEICGECHQEFDCCDYIFYEAVDSRGVPRTICPKCFDVVRDKMREEVALHMGAQGG